MQIKNTYLHQPVLYLSKFIKQHQQAYYEGLTRIHVQGDYEACIKFFLTGVIEMAQEAVQIARNIVMLREQDLKKINALGRISDNALTIYEGLFDKPTINIEEAATKLNISPTTSGRLLEKLCKEEILSNLSQRKRNKVLVYKKYLEAFSSD